MAAARNPPASVQTQQAGDIKPDLHATYQSPAKWPAEVFWTDDGAAVLLPKFKTSWTDKSDVIEAALTYVKNHLATTEQESQHQQRESSDDEDFFSRPLSTKLQSPVELDGYLACASDSMDLLHSFPAIKKLSMKLNTALPASAACERIFSCAGLLFTSKRSRIDSVNFENQLLLKLSQRFRR